MRVRRDVSVMILTVFAVVTLCTGCVTQRGVLSPPDGFAHYADRDLFTVVSPEAVIMRVRTEENDPPQSLDFWREAVKRHLSSSGYLLLEDGEGDFTSEAGAGVRYEWISPAGDEDWVYLTAMLVSGDRIVVVEAAGPYRWYMEHRAGMLESLSTIRLASLR